MSEASAVSAGARSVQGRPFGATWIVSRRSRLPRIATVRARSALPGIILSVTLSSGADAWLSSGWAWWGCCRRCSQRHHRGHLQRARAAGRRARRRRGPRGGRVRLRDGMLVRLAGQVRRTTDRWTRPLPGSGPPGAARRCPDRFGVWFPLIGAAREMSRCLLAASAWPSPSAGQPCVRPGPAGAPRRTGRRRIRPVRRAHAYCSNRHEPAPGATVSAHPGVSNENLTCR
jgi:hypothetical protein